MAYLERNTFRYIGSSLETKPVNADMPLNDVIPPGSSFLENDTGKIFRWDGFDWKHYEAIDERLQTLQLIFMELVALRERMELLTT